VNMYVTYDEEADVLAVDFGVRTERTGSRDYGDSRFVEFNERGEPICVEFLVASEGIDLTGIPFADEIRAALHRVGVLLETKVQTSA
jgi:uncharacterized protein YuzE